MENLSKPSSTKVYETVKDFSKRTGLPYKVVLVMAKSEELPMIYSGRTMYLHIEKSIEVIEKNSMRVVDKRRKLIVSIQPENLRKKFKGRYPDKVRDALREMKEASGEG